MINHQSASSFFILFILEIIDTHYNPKDWSIRQNLSSQGTYLVTNKFKLSRIWETKHLSTDADSSTNTKKILQNLLKTKEQQNLRGSFTPFISKSY